MNRLRRTTVAMALTPLVPLVPLMPLMPLVPLLPLPGRAATPKPQLATYLGGGCTGRDRLPAFTQWLGRQPDLLVDFLAAGSWADMQTTAQWAGDCWREWAGRVVISIPLLPRDGQSTLAAGAAGDFDAHIRAIATRLAERGHGRAVIRPGWEFNAPWFPWSAHVEPQAFVAYWRRLVGVMRSVPNTQFRFDWCPVLGLGVASPEPAWPGGDVVDLVGADVYNVDWFAPGTTAQQRWLALRDAPFGLQWHRRFAAARGKPMSYPEWGTGTRPDGHGGGDDAVFMQGMVAWIGGNAVAYHGYWDYPAPDFNAQLSDGRQPAAAAVYLAAYGVRP